MNDIDLAYYPGCTLSSTAREIDAAVQYVCSSLGIHLSMLPDWNCCGSSSIHAVRPQLAISLGARNLFQAQSMGRNLMVMCAGCANRLRVASNQPRRDDVSRHINQEILGATLDRDLHVYHLMDLLPNRLAEKPYSDVIQHSLSGLRYVPYYGCLLAAPPELKNYPRLHRSMESIMDRLGAEKLPWGYQAKCCGAFLSVAKPDIVAPMVDDIMAQAQSVGADCVVTACAMCQLNLELRSPAHRRMPVFSVVELLAYGLGAANWPDWFKKHLIDPLPLFQAKKFAG